MDSLGFQRLLLTERILFYSWLPAKFNSPKQEWNAEINSTKEGLPYIYYYYHYSYDLLILDITGSVKDSPLASLWKFFWGLYLFKSQSGISFSAHNFHMVSPFLISYEVVPSIL